MFYQRIFFIIALLYAPAHSLWTCTQDSDCSSVVGSICSHGDCMCPPGQQSVFGGTVCVDLAPYHTSPCVEDHQCSRLFSTFECRRRAYDDEIGSCFCQPNHHFFLGRCWPTIDYGAVCSRSEECLSVLRDPFSLTCNVTCECADGYYERQRGECRKIGFAVGDGCVLNEDCQFEDGACNPNTFNCFDINAPDPVEEDSTSEEDLIAEEESPEDDSPEVDGSHEESPEEPSEESEEETGELHGFACNFANPCRSPFECSNFGSCVCPIGYYYNSNNATVCFAELGSPSIPEHCVGLFAEVRNGICTCQANFYFEENMRDCIKATRNMNESCVTDSNCHTFGSAARCGEPQTWGLRSCECDPELAVWDAAREMCRLFAGIGESCEVDSDCLAGELEIHCVLNEEGEGTCTCPDGYTAEGGLCLTTGLDLGDACQASSECTETEHLACQDGLCACDSTGYQELDGVCAPIIGGVCFEDSDCVIEHTVCYNDTNGFTCQCDEQFVRYGDDCWPVVPGINATCEVNAQCEQALGDTSVCQNGSCVCIQHHHYRDGGCWPITDLFEGCARSSQCYLPHLVSERAVCRNSLCQCEFHYPFSEELHTCLSSATNIVGSLLIVSTSLFYLYIS